MLGENPSHSADAKFYFNTFDKIVDSGDSDSRFLIHALRRFPICTSSDDLRLLFEARLQAQTPAEREQERLDREESCLLDTGSVDFKKYVAARYETAIGRLRKVGFIEEDTVQGFLEFRTQDDDHNAWEALHAYTYQVSSEEADVDRAFAFNPVLLHLNELFTQLTAQESSMLSDQPSLSISDISTRRLDFSLAEVSNLTEGEYLSMYNTLMTLPPDKRLILLAFASRPAKHRIIPDWRAKYIEECRLAHEVPTISDFTLFVEDLVACGLWQQSYNHIFRTRYGLSRIGREFLWHYKHRLRQRYGIMDSVATYGGYEVRPDPDHPTIYLIKFTQQDMGFSKEPPHALIHTPDPLRTRRVSRTRGVRND